MSQTVVPPPAPAPSSAQPSAPSSTTAAAARARRAGTVDALLAVVRRELSGTPGRLRVISAGAVLAALVGALLGGWALQLRSSALDDASAAASHLVLLQGVQTRLAQADADATNGYLEFGPEPQDKLQEYRDAMAAASTDLAKASRGGEADAAALGPANRALVQYAGLIEAGRVYNAEQNLVGASFVLSATQLMESGVLGPIEERAAADSAAIDSAYGTAGNARWLLAAGVVLGLGGLLFAQRQVSRQSHRYVNVPMAAGTVLLLVGFGVAGANMAGAQSAANDVKDGSLASSTELSRARVAAFQAKSIESRTIIQRGSATTKDADWTEQMQRASALEEPAAAVSGLAQYRKLHVAMNEKDAGGDWDGARQQVIATGRNSINAAFATFADGTEQPLTTASQQTTQGLADAGGRLLPAGIALVVLGLVAAGAAWWGVSQRLGEYR